MSVRSGPARHQRWLLASLLIGSIVGCSTNQTADQALKKALESSGQQREVVYPLAGKVTVDGLPPKVEPGEKIVIMLNDPAKLDVRPGARPHVVVGPNGEFAFHTYMQDDGVKPGTYVFTFARLKVDKKKGFAGPDGFQNLYNDPERNEKENPDFKIVHQGPGKTDYEIELKIAGREGVAASPGALTELVFGRKR